ncbi:MAG: response regulator transcription factor [Balneolaceae bacterium]
MQTAGSGNTLFIVEDNEAIRLLIRGIVSRPNDSVFEFNSAETAVTRYAELKPDCIFMDIDLKGKDGLWACREICKQHAEARIVIVSSHNTLVFRKAATEAGAVAYVWKEELETLNTVMGTLG